MTASIRTTRTSIDKPFTSLLHHDPAQATHVQHAPPSYWSWLGFPSPSEDVIALSKSVGVAGPDRDLVVQELKRIRHAKGSAARRKWATLAGLATLFTTGGTIYLAIGACVTLVQLGHTDDILRWAFALAQLVTFLTLTVGQIIMATWLRMTRRPTLGSSFVLAGAVITVSAHLIFASTNFVLIYAWRSRVARRCSWGIDLVWTWGRAGDDSCTIEGEGSSLKSWAVAGGIRVLVILVLAAVWMRLIGRFMAALEVAFIVDPNRGGANSAEIQMLFDSKKASIVAVDGSAWGDAVKREGGLPAMPERYRELVATGEEANGPRKSWFTSAVDWLFGRPSDQVEFERGDDEEKQRLTYADPIISPEAAYLACNPSQQSSYSTDSAPATPVKHASTYRSLFEKMTSPTRARSDSDSMARPILPYDGGIARGHNWREYDGSSETASSTDEGGRPLEADKRESSYTFVQMTDGRLVRRLSTIESHGSRERSGSSDDAESEANTSTTVDEKDVPGAWRAY